MSNNNKKLNLLNKMLEFKKNGMTLSQNYTMDSDTRDMEYEVYVLQQQHNKLRNNFAFANLCNSVKLFKHMYFHMTDKNADKTVREYIDSSTTDKFILHI